MPKGRKDSASLRVVLERRIRALPPRRHPSRTPTLVKRAVDAREQFAYAIPHELGASLTQAVPVFSEFLPRCQDDLIKSIKQLVE